jgi:tetratricopeptide (TPR) repeat protein
MERAFAAIGPGKKATLTVVAAGGSTSLDLTLESAPREVRPGERGVLYNKTLMDLNQTIEGYPGTEAAAYARLNLGIIALHFRDFPAAHDAFVRARNELPDRPGVNRGTASFHAGVALEALGYAREALEEYQKAALDEVGTIGSRAGPLVKHVAARRIAALSAGR